MARAAVQYLRTDTSEWKAVGVWLATPAVLQSRFLPGVGMESFARNVHQGARPPRDDRTGRAGTWEDWVGRALDSLSNGHDLMVAEVQPETTVDELYAREVLGLPRQRWGDYRPKGIPNVSSVPVEDLGGPGART